MAIRNQNWYNANETRRYPLDDASTGVDDAAQTLRDSVIVDCNIRFDAQLGDRLYVQGITSTPGLISVVFGAAAAGPQAVGQTVAAVTVPKPFIKYRHYPIEPLVPGIDGWVVFGAGGDETCTFRFTNPDQSVLSLRCAAPYTPLPVPSIKKIGVGSALSDVITFEGLLPVTTTHEQIELTPGQTVDAIFFKLDTQSVTADYNPLAEFLGPCAGRPDSGTCGREPIESINGVEPDCAGNIEILFTDGLTAIPFHEGGGMGVDIPNSLSELCAALDPKRPQEFTDKCCVIYDTNGEIIPQNAILVFSAVIAFPSVGEVGKYYLDFTTNFIYRWSGSSYIKAANDPIDPFCWPKIENIAPDLIDDDEELNVGAYPCVDVPQCIDFIHCSLTDNIFTTESGVAERVEVVAPPPCPYCDGTIPNGGNHGVLGVSAPGSATVYGIKNCRTNWFYNKKFTTELQLPFLNNGYDRTAGLVFNYYYDRENFRVITRYFAVVLNRELPAVQVIGYTGNQYVVLSTANITLDSFADDAWFSLSATVSGDGLNSSASVAWELRIVGAVPPTNPEIVSGQTIVPGLYFTKFGLHGLYARSSVANFNLLQVQP